MGNRPEITVHVFYAPINVKPLGGGGGGGIDATSLLVIAGGGRPGIGGGFDVTSLLVIGTFDHSLSSRVATFDFNC